MSSIVEKMKDCNCLGFGYFLSFWSGSRPFGVVIIMSY
jgi:hypothetical protein